MLKVTAFEVPPPPPGLKTVTLAVPALAMSLAIIVAVRCVPPEPEVGRLDPFQRTTDPPTKFDPLTVRVKFEPPATVEFGLILLIEGVCARAGIAVQTMTTNTPSNTRPASSARRMTVRFIPGFYPWWSCSSNCTNVFEVIGTNPRRLALMRF